MKYSMYVAFILYLISSHCFGMEVVLALFYHPSKPNMVQPEQSSCAIEHTVRLQFDESKKISRNIERLHAISFIGCLNKFRIIALKALEMHKEGYEKLSTEQNEFLTSFIKTNETIQYKVQDNRNAVYKQVCSFNVSSPEAMTAGLDFWRALLAKKKINQELFEEQLEQTKKLQGFIKELTARGLICQYPRTVGGKTVFKAAL